MSKGCLSLGGDEEDVGACAKGNMDHNESG